MISDRNFLRLSLSVAGLGAGVAFALAVAVMSPARADRGPLASAPMIQLADALPMRVGSVR